MTWGSAGQMVRPDAAMGYAACEDAEKNHPESGITGAGTGASVGKICGREYATKTGLGIYAVSAGSLKVAAVVVLNALGDIYDPSTGEKIAGPNFLVWTALQIQRSTLQTEPADRSVPC